MASWSISSTIFNASFGATFLLWKWNGTLSQLRSFCPCAFRRCKQKVRGSDDKQRHRNMRRVLQTPDYRVPEIVRYPASQLNSFWVRLSLSFLFFFFLLPCVSVSISAASSIFLYDGGGVCTSLPKEPIIIISDMLYAAEYPLVESPLPLPSPSGIGQLR